MNLRELSDEDLRMMLAQAKTQQKSKLDATDQAMMDPTAGQSWLQNAAAGIGKSGYDTVRGLGNIVTDLIPGAANLGFATRADTDETNKRDAALTNSSGGFWGNLAGQVGQAAFLPASNLPKALAAGAALGFAQPVGTNDSRTENTALGAGFGAAIPAAAAGLRAGRAVLEPAVAPQRAAARILEQFADDPQAMRLAAENAKELVPGSLPTLAQAAQQPGISTLERGAFNQPGPMQKAMTDRMIEQNQARVGALNELAGKDGKLDFFKMNREVVAQDLYAKAMAEVPGDTTWIKGEVTKLMQRPAFVSALKEGQEMMLNLGGKVDPKRPEYATEILHYTKLALDDSIEKAVAQSSGNKSRAMIDTRDKLVSLMESKDFSPSYREARDTFKKMSGPINEMEIAGDLSRKIVPALDDVAGVQAPQRLLANNFAADVRRRSGDIERSFSPEGKSKLEAVVQDLQRKASAEGLGKATGSPTAQYLTTQNLMRQIAGPLGLPQGFAEKTGSALMATPFVGSALQWAGKGAESRMQSELAQMLLDPKTAAQALALINKQPGRMGQMGGAALPYMPSGLSAAGLFAANGR